MCCHVHATGVARDDRHVQLGGDLPASGCSPKALIASSSRTAYSDAGESEEFGRTGAKEDGWCALNLGKWGWIAFGPDEKCGYTGGL
jgi:hypothetical protein